MTTYYEELSPGDGYKSTETPVKDKLSFLTSSLSV